MPLSALALVIFAGLIHASWNIAAKKAGGDARFACFTALVMMVFWAPLGLWLGWHAAMERVTRTVTVGSGLTHVTDHPLRTRWKARACACGRS